MRPPRRAEPRPIDISEARTVVRRRYGVSDAWPRHPEERERKMGGMAAVEPLDAADPTDPGRWLVIRGAVREGDLVPLLEGVQAADRQDATLDLLEVDDLTAGGCWAIRVVADELWQERRRLTVVYRLESPCADQLRSSGTIRHPHIIFHGSAGGPT